MTSVLITGANRGLGLGLVEQFLKHPNPPALVLAACRDPAKADKLKILSQEYKQLRIIKLDVADTSSFPAFVKEVSSIVGDSGLNVLINNAGIAVYKTRLEQMTPEDYLKVYQTNLIGPVFLIKEILPLIKLAAQKNADKPEGMNRAAILNMSSFLGSVSENTTGDYLAYRESKAALNTFTRTLWVEQKDSGILILPIHPGWVQTDMGGPKGLLTVETSVSGMCDLIYSLDSSKNGQFLQWDGTELLW